ncbi:MAG: PIG-L family deacetylase [Acidimicrobiales bacterium]
MPADSDVDRVLVITAHPDDVDFGAGGTVATWTEAGIDVCYCVVTDGDAGGFDPAVPRSEIGGIRRAEQTAAAAELGVSEVVFLGYPDGQLAVSMSLRRDLSRVIRTVRPQRVLCHTPERSYDNIYGSHPDHLAVGEAALCAVYPDARNPFAHPELAAEGHLEWTVSEVWMMTAGRGPTFVDITATFARKVAALRRHASQLTDPAAIGERMRQWGRAQAGAAGLPDDRLAEGFRVLATA